MQRQDIRRDLLEMMPSHGPFSLGQSVWYWERDMPKLRSGHCITARVIGLEKPPMLLIEVKGHHARVNQSKMRNNPDEWHGVVIPGLDGRDGVVIVSPEVPERQEEE